MSFSKGFISTCKLAGLSVKESLAMLKQASKDDELAHLFEGEQLPEELTDDDVEEYDLEQVREREQLYERLKEQLMELQHNEEGYPEYWK